MSVTIGHDPRSDAPDVLEPPAPGPRRRSLRGWLKAAVVGTNERRLAATTTRRIVVLCYHSIHPDSPFSSATPRLFATHLDWLVRHCRVVPLETIACGVRPCDLDDRPAVAITFDDGYLDNHDHAFPLLHERGLTATFFVTAGLLENDASVIDRLSRLRATGAGAIRPMTWEHARLMLASGMEIGAHTYSHPNLARLSRHAARDELARSKSIIEQRLGSAVASVAYPFGKPRRHFTSETVSVVRDLGYRYACQVLFRGVRRSDSPFRIPRFFVRRDSIDELRAKVIGAWDPIGAWQERSPLWLARFVSPRDFPE